MRAQGRRYQAALRPTFGRPNRRGIVESIRLFKGLIKRVGRQFREVGNPLAKPFFAGSFYFACSGKTRINTGEKDGGDDETRTRDLCRDRAAF